MLWAVHRRTPKRPSLSAAGVLMLVLGIMLFAMTKAPVQHALYRIEESVMADRQLASVASWNHLVVDGDPLYFTSQQRPELSAVVADIRRAMTMDCKLLQVSCAPVPIILTNSEDLLQHELGWNGADQAIGAYDQGVVYLLSPSAMGETSADYRFNGPVAHELTHALLDRQTAGNFPYWYTEGLAQAVDEQVTGYVWNVPQNRLDARPWYSITQLQTDFYALPSQAMAYREALAMVHVMIRAKGFTGIDALDRALATGDTFAQASAHVFGLSPAELFNKAKADHEGSQGTI